MVEAASGPVEFDCDGDAGGNAGSEAEEEAKSKRVADAEDEGVGYRAGEQAERPVLAAEEVVSEIQATQHVETGAADTDGCEGVVVHSALVIITGVRDSKPQKNDQRWPA